MTNKKIQFTFDCDHMDEEERHQTLKSKKTEFIDETEKYANSKTDSVFVKHINDNIEKSKNINLENIMNLVLIKGNNIYDVSSNIKQNTQFCYLSFIVDTTIYKRYQQQVETVIQSIINDFYDYFKKALKDLKNFPFELCLTTYSSVYSTKLFTYSFESKHKLFEDLRSALKNKYVAYGKGEVDAVNTLTQLKEETEKFVFHFCNSNYHIDEVNNTELNQCLRDYNVNYEIIYFEDSNETFEQKAMDVFMNFQTNIVNK